MPVETYTFHEFNIPINLLNMTGGGVDTFDAISDGHMSNLKKHIGISSEQFVLEIGCGIGRDAIPLTKLLDEQRGGRYLGVDIIEDSISFCINNIKKCYGNFDFVWFNIDDQLHNPKGVEKTIDISLPLPNNCVDRVILWSVFTHMYEHDIRHYLQEFQRVLKQDGLVYATVFVVDDDILDSARKTNLTQFDLRFEHRLSENCFINDPVHPLGAVAYTADTLKNMVDDAGLEMKQDFLPGGWSGFHKHPQDGQDVMILGTRQKEPVEPTEVQDPARGLDPKTGSAEERNFRMKLGSTIKRNIKRTIKFLFGSRIYVLGPEIKPTPIIIKRIIKYVEYINKSCRSSNYVNSMWDSTIVPNYCKSTMDYFLAKKYNECNYSLEHITKTSLTYGYDPICKGGVDTAAVAYKALEKLLQEMGEEAIYKQNNELDIENIFPILDERLGFRLEFPQHFEYSQNAALATSRGPVQSRMLFALYYVWNISQNVKDIKNSSVLEIGAGTGRTAYFAYQFGFKKYTIIDILSTNIVQAHFNSCILGNDKILLSGENEGESHFLKIMNNMEYDNLNDKFDIIANFDGLTEYGLDQASKYFDKFHKLTDKFISINHTSNYYTMSDLYENKNICIESSEECDYRIDANDLKYFKEIIKFV